MASEQLNPAENSLTELAKLVIFW